jgi:FkbM family methyltransferase
MNDDSTSPSAASVPDVVPVPERKLDESDLSDLSISEGDLVLDCGASVGDVSEVLAEMGAEVYAFEPNPVAFARLAERFENSSSVTCYQKAVSIENGSATFYPHESLVDDPTAIDTANGSSLLAFKSNVRTDHGYEVETIDLAAFIKGLGRPVRLLKIDIEGAEIEVVNRLIDEHALDNVAQVLVETHERKITELREATDALRKRIADEGLSKKVSLDWH